MRLLQVIPSYLPATRYGGPLFAAHGLSVALAARGHHVEVFTTNADGRERMKCGPAEMDGVRVNYFAARYFQRLSWAPAMARSLREKATQFDLVHVHTVFLWPTWAAAHAARAAGVPYLISPRGMLVQQLIARRNWLLKRLWLTLIEHRNLVGAAALHVTSERERADVAAFGWELPRIETIPNGISPLPTLDASPISDLVRSATTNRPYALYLGRLCWKKGLDRLLRAFACTETGALVIAGTDDEMLSRHLKGLVDALGMKDRVTIIAETMGGTDKDHLFRNARLFVLPSYSENFGNTVVEALSYGVPVIVTPEVGAAEIVERSGGGIVVSAEPDTLGRAMATLLQDPVSAQALGVRGRTYVEANLGWPVIAARMEEFYLSVIEAQSGNV